MLHLRTAISGYGDTVKVSKWVVIESRSEKSGVSSKDIHYEEMSEESKRLFNELVRISMNQDDNDMIFVIDETSKVDLKKLEDRLILESEFWPYVQNTDSARLCNVASFLFLLVFLWLYWFFMIIFKYVLLKFVCMEVYCDYYHFFWYPSQWKWWEKGI